MVDAHNIRFEVTMKNGNERALAQGDQEQNLIKSIQQRKRTDNRNKLREN